MSDARPSLTLVRRIKAPPARVYAAWIDPAQIARWWGPEPTTVISAEADPRPGGRYRVVFRSRDGERHDCRGSYHEVEQDRRLVFTWSWVSTPERQSLVTVEIRAIEAGSELTLTHAQFYDEAARDRHRGGWTGALEKLVAMLEREPVATEETTR
ncbi:MAG: SRPBCC domain-containing protein [Acetobacteraceae bacterium]|nr:SRPBCC domain-containing protein [Acetobacteraceae bacterium]